MPVRVQRDIKAAGFEDGQEQGDNGGAPPGDDAHRLPWLHAPPDQAAGQPVGPVPQAGKGPFVCCVCNGDGFRLCRDLACQIFQDGCCMCHSGSPMKTSLRSRGPMGGAKIEYLRAQR